jgi:hypothetical protein
MRRNNNRFGVQGNHGGGGRPSQGKAVQKSEAIAAGAATGSR